MIRLRSGLFFLLGSVVSTGVMSAQETAAGASTPPVAAGASTAPSRLTETELLEIYGWMAGMRAGISRLGLTDVDLAAFQRGIANAGAGTDLEVDLQAVGPEISRFVQKKFDAHMAALKKEQAARAATFWESLRSNPAVHQLDSGLAYEIMAPGTGPHPAAPDTIKAHYTGRLIDGEVFDRSEGGAPFETRLDQVIEGWTQGLPLIGAGGAIKLYVPPELGYGDAGTPSIPPGATLIFDVELVEVIPAQASDGVAPAAPLGPAE